MNVKQIFKKENLVSAAGLGAGSLAAEILVSKLGPMLAPKGEDPTDEKDEKGIIGKIVPVLPILAGLVLATGTGVMKSIGHGMLASGVSGYAKKLIPEDTKISLGLGQDVMMGNVMMGEDLPVLGYSSDNYDYTSGDAGEMNY